MVLGMYSAMQLIVSDLDGTLVNYAAKEVPRFTRDVIASVTQTGCRFSIATGRDWEGARPIVAQLGITTPLILQSGALIVEPPQPVISGADIPGDPLEMDSTAEPELLPRLLRMTPLRPALDCQLLQLAKELTLNDFYLDHQECYRATRIATTEGETLFQKLHAVREDIMNDAVIGGDITDRPVLKHLFTGAEQPIKQLQRLLDHDVKPRPNLVLWPPDHGGTEWLLEVFDPLASKGQALQWLASYLKISSRRVMAFGNDWNDLDLLQYAGAGVAVANSPAKVLAAASIEIPGPEQEGVASFLKKCMHERNTAIERGG